MRSNGFSPSSGRKANIDENAIDLGDIPVDGCLKKDIKNIHLSVHPPGGPGANLRSVTVETGHHPGFRRFQAGLDQAPAEKMREQERETPREYLDRESHFLWGKRYLLKLIEDDTKPSIELRHNQMVLRIRQKTNKQKRHLIVDEWYREQVKRAVPDLIAKWEPLIGVKVNRVFVRRMKTRWGSCNFRTGSIRLNTDLAKKPIQNLEYVVVHEMVHLLEHSHNARFVELMERFMPQWQHYRDQLNRLPVRHEKWIY